MENKVYLITGASSDMGRAFIKSLDEQLSNRGKSATILAHYALSADRITELKEEVKTLEIQPIQADLSVPEETEKLIGQVKEVSGCPDYIIHFPATKLVYNRIKQFDWGSVRRDMEIQVHSLAEIGKTFLPVMGKRKSGRIVVMLTSCTLGMPPKCMSQYTVVKYALMGLMKSMAMEYADKGVTVNGISPNMAETRFLSEIDDRLVEMNRESGAMKRNVEVAEVVSAIHFLLSDGASYVNGVNLNLTGGDK